MYSFRNDYSEGAHPKVLQALIDTNLEQNAGYGLDPHCQAAADMIRQLCKAPSADVHFLVGGTQTNLVALSAFLRPYEAAIAAVSGHIAVHETGAIEAAGHKVCTVESPDGKLTPALVESVLAAHTTEHMVLPRLVYLSNATEVGTVYTRRELAALRQCCDSHGLYLYLDGARLGSALTAQGSDLTLADLASLTDAFYIGGTKHGALFGEALVLSRPLSHFRWHMKQRGAMLAKGWLLGIQFQILLEDGLYFDLARHANRMAAHLREGLSALGCPSPVDARSNLQYFSLPRAAAEALAEKGYTFETEPDPDPTRIHVRLVTSWATPEAAVEQLLGDLSSL